MKISWLWLKEFLPVEHLRYDEAAERLTLIGFEVEAIQPAGRDRVFTLEITPNRPDALSVTGLARELAAAYGAHWRAPVIPPWPRLKKTDDGFQLHVEDFQDCLVYHGVLIEDVRIGPSPDWLKQRLETVGLRSINNVVDVTNYVMWETGHPLHAFDAATVRGRRVIVRRARAGEPLATLDGATRTLSAEDIVIADENEPIALAGVIGGASTQITESTAAVFLETAVFDPLRIRRSARRHKIQTESSYRFERRVDPAGVEAAARRAAVLIQQTAGGAIRQRLLKRPKQRPRQRTIVVGGDEIGARLGVEVPAARIRRILKNLDFNVTSGGKKIRVTPPSFRFDVTGPHDVIEEIARMIGYDAIPEREIPVRTQDASDDALFTAEGRWRRCLADRGFFETITHPLISSRQAAAWGRSDDRISRLINPLNRDQDVLRPSLLPGLLAVVRHNIHHGHKRLRLFEIGKAYADARETPRLAMAVSGPADGDWRLSVKDQQRRTLDFWDVKNAFEALCRLNVLPEPEWERSAVSGFKRDTAAVCRMDGRLLAWGGRIDDAVLQAWDIDQDVYAVEVDTAVLLALKGTRRFHPWPVFPAIIRDISCAVPKDIMFQQVKTALMEWGRPWLVKVTFKELYGGPGLPDGRVGWVVGLVYRDARRTLTETDVQPVHEELCRRLSERFEITLR